MSHDFEQISGQTVSLRVKTLRNATLVALRPGAHTRYELLIRHIKRKKGSVLVDVRRIKTSLLKLPNDDMKPSKRQVSLAMILVLKYIFLSESK